MLKFIRKYQLIMLAIGGSLLMVVFLIGPIIQKIGPALANRTAFTLDGGAASFSAIDRHNASLEVQAISQVFPFMFGDAAKGSRGLIDLEDNLDHWLLLSYEADQAGFIGESEDGRIWIEQELAYVYARTEKQYQLYQQIPYMPFVNQQMQQASVQAEINQRAEDLRTTVLPSRVRQVAAGRGVDDATIYRMLAKARGVLRMKNRYERSIRQSDRDIVDAVHEFFDSAIADYVYIPASMLVDDEMTPTDEELQAQFERFKDEKPGVDELGFGYTLPPRVQLGWMTFDHAAIARTITPDRVEVHKRWNENRDRFPGELAEERSGVEKELVDEEVNNLMIEADRVIVGRLRTALRSVPKVGRYYDIPDTWGAETMETLAQAVVDELKDQRGIDFPLPGITYRTEKWFTEEDLAQIPGFGRAYWRVGPDRIPVTSIPSLARDLGGSSAVAIQKRIPVIDPEHARDDQGNSYYIVLFGTREESPPDSWEDIREQLVTDVRKLNAYESLTAQLDELKAMATEDGGLEQIAAHFNPPDQSASEEIIPDDAERLSPSRWGVFTRNQIRQLDPAKPVDARANIAELRNAVVDQALDLDPMVPFGELSRDNTVLAMALPAQQAVAVANILAFRPATTEQRYSIGAVDIATLSAREFGEIESDAPYPFSLEALKQRHQFKLRRGDDEQDQEN